ncbi:MAG: response regulator [Thermodesulfobacteriota bacterium]
MTKKVLIVEDEAIHAMALADVIPLQGIGVAGVVDNGEEAVRAAERLGPDVVLMDVRIRGSIDGLGAAREIAGRLKIPVIFMTGLEDPETLAKAREVHPLAILAKPLDVDLLVELLHRV